jgi:hypothetical protein
MLVVRSLLTHDLLVVEDKVDNKNDLKQVGSTSVRKKGNFKA